MLQPNTGKASRPMQGHHYAANRAGRDFVQRIPEDVRKLEEISVPIMASLEEQALIQMVAAKMACPACEPCVQKHGESAHVYHPATAACHLQSDHQI
jgi:hypothetical protein